LKWQARSDDSLQLVASLVASLLAGVSLTLNTQSEEEIKSIVGMTTTEKIEEKKTMAQEWEDVKAEVKRLRVEVDEMKNAGGE